MQTLETKMKKSFKLTLIISILSLFFYPFGIGATEYTLDDVENAEVWQINQDINEKRSEIQELNRQVGVYKKNINAKQKELATLSNQVSTLNQSIAKINLEVQSAELEMETINLKIENTQLKIQAKEREIGDQKETIAEVLRDLHVQQQKSSTLEILLLNDNFSDFISELDRLESMQDSLVGEVDDLNGVKIALVGDQTSLETERTELDTLKRILDNKKGTLDSQKSTKNTLMIVTEGQESKFQQLLQQAKEEQEQANSDIVYLEKVAREKLNRQLKEEQITSEGLMWPVSSRRVTAYFHDPDYPYRYIFEHPAIDIATPQGSPIVAADTGYVAKARDGGQTGYSYIMLIHADGLSTVYGHVNQISVSNDQLVGKGQIIGYSGGLPGTRGAGSLSTGPHLHLELRMNGIPINPLNYLP
ncbi:peptidoglycan DD-metalloendopeptidase family protein [Candidatus Parcubacteria bacterium]|nr:peptidoglycan DD-metalloendopeptidase family protein [Candidatus Parcubacteria bacterium]